MIVALIILSLVTIVAILFYDKKGSIRELERYYQTHNITQKQVVSNKQTKENKQKTNKKQT